MLCFDRYLAAAEPKTLRHASRTPPRGSSAAVRKRKITIPEDWAWTRDLHTAFRRPRDAITHARAWVRGEVTMMQARAAGGHAMGVARDLRGPARHAAYAAGQAGAVAHVAAHDLGAAAYAIKSRPRRRARRRSRKRRAT